MKLLPYNQTMEEQEKTTVSMHITKDNKLEIVIDNILRINNEPGGIRTNLAKILYSEVGNTEYIVWPEEDYYSARKVTREEFEQFVASRGAIYDWSKIVMTAESLHQKYNSYRKDVEDILKEALRLGKDKECLKKLRDIRFNRNNPIFASFINSSVAVFVYKPDNIVYVFDTTELHGSIIKTKVFMDLIKLHSNFDWCTCDDKSNTEYVENYRGVSHGWICRKCKRFVQTG